jgi:hypothetical protein
MVFSFKTVTVSFKLQYCWSPSLVWSVLCIMNFYLRPDNESYHPKNHSATSSKHSSLETASQTIFQYLASSQQWNVLSSPKCQVALGQPQHPSDYPSTLSHLIPCNFFLFPRQTITLKGRRTSRLPRDTTKHSREAEGQPKTSLPHIHWKV